MFFKCRISFFKKYYFKLHYYNMYSLYSHGFFLNFFIWNTTWLDWKSENQSENNKLNRWWIQISYKNFYFSPLSFLVYRWSTPLVFRNSILISKFIPPIFQSFYMKGERGSPIWIRKEKIGSSVKAWAVPFRGPVCWAIG